MLNKTELVIFKHKKEKLKYPKKIKLSRKRLYHSDSIKFLDAKIDENLNWKDYIHDIATKANALLSKIRSFVSFNALKSIYFAILDSHMNYTNHMYW